ncbi:hypothetical protein HDK77DRAFT_444551 [Phyllosticta capitalensis]|uniref:BZIP domain-containing protein n=1 Tax=Phyllosticta capitalensis TaxID=121624 RepID=A0ABR1YLM9_9PEZI
MSTIAAQPMGYQAFNTNQCFDPDMDSLIDFNAIQSPAPASSSQMAPSTVASTMASPTNSILPLDQAEDHQTPAKPSHEYELFKQQTGLPSGSLPGIQMPSMNQPMRESFNFSNSGLGFDDGWGDFDMDTNMGNSGPVPNFMFGSEGQQKDDFVDPHNIQQQSQQNIRFFPGMHQQQAALAAKAQAQAQQQRQQQMLQQQQQQQHQHHQQQREQQGRHHAQRKSAQFTDARTEETIARVVNQIRQNSILHSQQADANGSGVLPHIVKMKKDEEEMDEDERLLASEEGKKLSSKERRQLRNKVSARAFRSRRKEYISQLEGEVAAKQTEANELLMQNRALMEENARSRAFIERLLRHQAFVPFLDELSRDPALSEPAKMPAAPVSQAPAQQNFNTAPPMMKESSHENTSQMGMSMIPEQSSMAFDMNNNNVNYFPGSGFNFNQPQVFAVLELPEGPTHPFELEGLSGKGSSSIFSPVEETVKPDFPVIERPEFVAEKPAASETAEVEEVDDGNPDFALYFNSPAPSSASYQESLFGHIAPEKAFARIEVTLNNETPEQQQQRFDRATAKLDAACERVLAMCL